MMKTIILDPGHGMANKRAKVYDPGACAAGETEAGIALDWANELRGLLLAAGHKVVRTRVDGRDPAPVGQRAAIARRYGGDIMISLHCNAATGQAHGTETFFRGKEHAPMATRLNEAVRAALGTRDRGIKTEAASQHRTLAIMAFQPCFLIELGFIDHDGDRTKMLDPALRRKACAALAEVLLA
ncbi:N-acetylmuramoyl-L-alanine amidase [Prosthecobacter sp. SYSU 5D2]|uniref:N-acetylmuramoyl-L-alanine amidase family protein n=1 Tax=Prosthecobacter sp. SYSU 5D2 TaxID=3134134 RepID=UPI0031FF3840